MAVNESCRFCHRNLKIQGVISHSTKIFERAGKAKTVFDRLVDLGLTLTKCPEKSIRTCQKCTNLLSRIERDLPVFRRWEEEEKRPGFSEEASASAAAGRRSRESSPSRTTRALDKLCPDPPTPSRTRTPTSPRPSVAEVTEANSNTREPLGFQRGLEQHMDEGLAVQIMTPDRSSSSHKLLRESLPQIKHHFDEWDTCKGLRKKLLKLASCQDCRELMPWVTSICNHMWWSRSTCGGDKEELMRKWTSLLHHICGVHRWEEDGVERRCYHAELTAEQQKKKRWLHSDSSSFKALYSVVRDERLLHDLDQMKHTGQRGVCHSAEQD